MRSKRFIEDANILSASLILSMSQRRCILCGGYHLSTGATPWLQIGRKAGMCRQFFGRFNRSTRNSFEWHRGFDDNDHRLQAGLSGIIIEIDGIYYVVEDGQAYYFDDTDKED